MNNTSVTAAALRSVWSGTASAEELALLAAQESDEITEGLELQLAVLDRWRADGESLGGWKIGGCSRGARDQMGPGVRPFGYVLGRRVFGHRARLPLNELVGLRLEPEICLSLATPLAGREVIPDQARAAVGAVRAGFEIGQNRLPGGMSRSIRIGDGLSHWGIVIGPAVTVSVDLARLDVGLYHDGRLVDAGRSEPSVVDDPYVSLSRVCRTLADHGRGLQAGQHVITGSILAARAITAGEWRAASARSAASPSPSQQRRRDSRRSPRRTLVIGPVPLPVFSVAVGQSRRSEHGT